MFSHNGGHVGIKKTVAKKSWKFDSIIMQILFDILLLFCMPTWPSYHVSENTLFNSFSQRRLLY